PTDEEMPTLLGENRRRHARRSIHLDNLGRPTVRGQHCHGVGCPEIHGQNAHSTPYRCENDAHILALPLLADRIGACPTTCCSCSVLPRGTGFTATFDSAAQARTQASCAAHAAEHCVRRTRRNIACSARGGTQ